MFSQEPAMLCQRKRSAPKVRTGCVTCKRRRVKCDETKPSCERCKSSARPCEGYVIPKPWIFESSSEKAIPQLSPERRDPRERTPEFGSNHAVAVPEYSSTLRAGLVVAFGSPQERVVFQWFMEKVAVLASRWAAPVFWKETLPKASNSHPAIKQCLVALSVTDYAISGDNTITSLVDESRGLRSYYRAIEIFNRLPTTTSISSLETLLIASTAFWTFDLRNRRPALAALHLQATARLLKQMSETQKERSQLVLDVEEMLNGFAATAADEEPYMGPPITSSRARRATIASTPSRHSLNSPESFRSLQHARVSLARCTWALNLARNAEPGARVLATSVLDKLVFDEPAGLQYFSNPPYASLIQCRSLLSKWRSRLTRTKTNVPAIEKQILLLHAKMAGWTLWRVLEKGKKTLCQASNEGIDEADEITLKEFLEESQKLITARAQGSFDPAVSHATGMLPPLGLILLLSRSPQTLAQALISVEKVYISERGRRIVNIIFMGFICS